MNEAAIPGMFFDRVRKYGDRAALRSKQAGRWKSISWGEFGRTVEDFAMGLLDLGVEPGDRVALFSPNRPEWAFADMGILSVGAVTVPIYATNTAEQARFTVADSGARVAIVSDQTRLDRILQAREHLPGLEHIVAFDSPEKIRDRMVILFPDLVRTGADKEDSEEVRRRIARLGPDDLATIIYTSGTTGDPKGVMLSHRNILSNCEAALSLIPIGERDECLSFLPLSHSFERTGGYYVPIMAGATIAYAENIDTVAANLVEIRPTLMVSVPRLYEKMYARVVEGAERGGLATRKLFGWAIGVGREVSRLEQARRPIPPALAARHALARRLVFSRIRERLGGRLRFFISGGAPLAREIAEFFHAAGVLILEGYGLTETAPVLTANTPDHYRFGTVGRALPCVDLKIAEDGEILARGPGLMQGYHNRPADTADVMADGWFHTGDVGQIDDEGYLTITDRKKDIIITSGGKNIAPQNIENELKMNRFIDQVALIGDRHRYLVALVVPNFEPLEEYAKMEKIRCASREDLVRDPRIRKFMEAQIEEVSSHHPSHEQIKKFALLATPFSQEAGEITPTLKIKRKVVMAKYKGLVESLYRD